MNGASVDGERRVRVLWLTKGLATGGVERLLHGFALAGDRERFEYHVAYAIEHLDDLVDPLLDAGVAVHSLGAVHGLDPRWLPRLDRLLRRYRYDVVHVHSPFLAGFTRVLTRLQRPHPRLVSTEHTPWWGSNRLTALANAMLYRWDDARIAVSGQVRDSVWRPCRGGSRPVEVILHGLRRDDIEELVDAPKVRASLGLPSDGIVVAAVGNLRPEKQYDVLLHAARQVIDQDPRAVFVVVGDRGDRAGLERLRGSLGLDGHFLFTGRRTDVARILRSSDMFVMSSRFEGAPLSLLEAMDAALPIIAPAVGTVPDLVRDGIEGYVVPAGTADGLADHILRVMGDSSARERMGAAARARVQHLRFDDAVRRIEEIYADLAPTIPPKRL